jgi:serine/threonine-protein kinase
VSAELDLSDPRSQTHCPECGALLSHTRESELCCACLLGAALAAEGPRLGPYILLSALDAGSTGEVYIAKHVEHDGLVAIKLARATLLESPDGVAAFRTGIRIQKALRHQPNIVSIDDQGTHPDGRPYAVMPLLEGGTLADEVVLARYTEPGNVLALMIKLARAVARAHQRGVLHCDLKPANVLFNAEGEPFIGDFGLSRLLDPSLTRRGAAFHGGTLGFMSREQALQQDLTLASDVFSLGVLLYWLLTQSMPFGEGDAFLPRVLHQPAPPLRTQYRGRWSWELAQICARALHHDPEQRYRSAAELADDLERTRAGTSLDSERRRPLRRAAKWMRRHKLAALAAVELCLLLLYLPLLPISVFREVQSTVRDQLRFSALAQAGAVMNELRASARRVERLALDPEIKRLVQHTQPAVPPAALIARAGGVDGLSVFSNDGFLTARWPVPRVYHAAVHVAFRDYLQGAQRFAREGRRDVYVARAFHSTGDEEPMLALSTPLYEGERQVGTLVGRTRARATFGAVRMNCGSHGSCMTALLGPRDRDRQDQPLPDSIYVLAAPGLAEGQELMVEPTLARRVCAELACQPRANDQFEQAAYTQLLVLDDYEDPISHARSMAALAPVGGTGLIVLVATPNDALDAITERMTHETKAFLWIPVCLGLLLLGAVLAWPWLRGIRDSAG